MKEKLKKSSNIEVWVFWRSSRGRLENVLVMSRMNYPGTSLQHQIRTSPGRHFRMSLGRQIGTSSGRSNRVFRGLLGDVGEGHPWDVLGTNICWLGLLLPMISSVSISGIFCLTGPLSEKKGLLYSKTICYRWYSYYQNCCNNASSISVLKTHSSFSDDYKSFYFLQIYFLETYFLTLPNPSLP